MIATSAYIHIPFCEKRCSYCDFVTFDNQYNLIPQYFSALGKEISEIAGNYAKDHRIHSVFIGGGTPSCVPAEYIAELMKTLRNLFDMSNDCEITIECNPGNLTGKKVEVYREVGINRFSLGVQSSHPQDLKILNRIHDYYEVIKTIGLIRKEIPECRTSVDLIYGIPYQTIKRWESVLEDILLLNPDHISIYALTLEGGVPLERYVDRGLIHEIDLDLQAEMYETAKTRFLNSFAHYEISNWGKRQNDGSYDLCRHNLQYWNNNPWFGFGLNAHGFINKIRYQNEDNLKKYLSKQIYNEVQNNIGSFVKEQTEFTTWDLMQDTMMLGLRKTIEGVSFKEFQIRYGYEIDELFGSIITELENKDLLQIRNLNGNKHLILTEKGQIIGNQVFLEFINLPEPEILKNN